MNLRSRRLFPSSRSRAGYTLVELMVVVTIMSIIILAIVPIFNLAQWGFTSADSRNSLKTVGEESLNRVAHQLEECKRIFQNTASDTLFLARVQTTSMPTLLTGSLLPTIEENGALSPSTGTFVASAVGNSLFFASVDQPVTVGVLDSTASTQTIRIDTYQFNYYFLGEDPSGTPIGGQVKTTLWEWHSLSYVDYNEITGLTDSVESSNTVTALYDLGYQYAWNPSTTTVTAAFFQMSSGTLTSQPAHIIQEKSTDNMISIITGVTGGDYGYSVSPNTGGTYQPSATVPQFGVASGHFPSGFEVMVVGPNSARQVFMRMVLVAQGSFKGYVTQAMTTLASARDLW